MTTPPTLVRLTLAHPEGLHARVAAMWVQGLRNCEVEVMVSWNGRTVIIGIHFYFSFQLCSN